jgi:hypothetical protein
VAIDVEVSERAEIRNGSHLAVSSTAASAGDLRISGGDVLVIAGAQTQLGATNEASSGKLALDASEVRIEAGASVLSESRGGETGSPIEIRADELALRSGGQVLSRTSGGGASGRIAIDAESMAVAGASEVRSLATGAGAGGEVAIVVGELRLEDRGQIVSENTDTGPGAAIDVRVGGDLVVASRGKILSQATGIASSPGGAVHVSAGGRIEVVGQDSADADVSQISALTSSSDARGRAGDLRIRAPEIELRDAGQLRTTTSGAAPGGSLVVEQADLLRVVGNATVAGERGVPAGLFARSDPPEGFVGAGDGGALTIAARVVEVEDGGAVSTRTLGDGDAGSLLIRDAERVSVRGGPRGTSELSTRGAQGAGGDLEITAQELELASGGLVSASTLGSGDAGDLRVTADRISISDFPSGLFSQTTFGTSASGDAGDIAVAVGSWLQVRNGGRISVDSKGGGGAGDVRIHSAGSATVALVGGEVSATSVRNAAAGDVTIATAGDFVAGRGSSVATEAEDNASGGRVAISAGGIVYASDSRIETRVAGPPSGLGDAGDVDVLGPGGTPSAFGVLNRSSIVATARGGNGGNIQVAASDLLASQGVVVDATSERGVSGIVQITGPDADLAGQITPLPSNFFDAAKLMTAACDARRARAGSFVVQTRTAIPPLPDAPLPPPQLAPVAGGPGDAKCPS